VTIFLGAISALGIMTVLSAYVGHVATYIPRVYTFYISTALFIFFGLKMLKEGYYMDPDEGQEELEEVTMELNKKEQELVDPSARFLSPVFVQAFVLTFLAEWGDRSQISTIILGAREVCVFVCVCVCVYICVCVCVCVRACLFATFVAHMRSPSTLSPEYNL
jgi:putative Ca2+/H+ antiporter (TMEM165/GDT1 family)